MQALHAMLRKAHSAFPLSDWNVPPLILWLTPPLHPNLFPFPHTNCISSFFPGGKHKQVAQGRHSKEERVCQPGCPDGPGSICQGRGSHCSVDP